MKVPVGTQEWLHLMQAMTLDLHESSLDKFYILARSILIKTESLYDAFDQAFLICFKDATESLDLKEELLDWLNKMVEGERPPMPQIDPLTLEELRKKFLERLKEQMEEHHGGSHWIGTGGTSPFGHSGTHPSGIRIGGPGGGRMAMQVAEERRFANYRHDRTLDTRQFKVALKRLRKLDRFGAVEELSLDKTIDATCKNAGDIELIFEAEKKNQVELLLLMDVGGSMDPYVELIENLFSAAHASNHFKAFHHYYFHNCIYSKVFKDMDRSEAIPTADLFKKFRRTFRVIFLGDACMNPYELFYPGGAIDYWEQNKTSGIEWLKNIREHFPHCVWLNPEPETYWDHVTIRSVKSLFRMYPLSVEGLTTAIDDLRKEDTRVVPMKAGESKPHHY